MRCRGLLNDFLVPSLHGAVALTQIHGVLVLIGQDLNFNVAWVLEVFLHVNGWVAERRLRLCFGRLHGSDQVLFVGDHTHAATAPTACGLDDHGVTNAFGNFFQQRRVAGQLAFGAWHTWHAGFDHGLLGRDFVAHDSDGLWGGSNELKAALLHALGKICVLAQKAIPWMNRLTVGDLGRRDDGRHAEVTLRRRRRPDAHGLFREFDVLGLAIGL